MGRPDYAASKPRLEYRTRSTYCEPRSPRQHCARKFPRQSGSCPVPRQPGSRTVGEIHFRFAPRQDSACRLLHGVGIPGSACHSRRSIRCEPDDRNLCARRADSLAIHDMRQVLIVTTRSGTIQIKGQAPERLQPGDVATVPPGVLHWHGASANSLFAHISLTCEQAIGNRVEGSRQR